MAVKHPRQPEVARNAAVEFLMVIRRLHVFREPLPVPGLELADVVSRRVVKFKSFVRVAEDPGRGCRQVVRRIVEGQAQMVPLADLPVHADSQVVVAGQLGRVAARLAPGQSVTIGSRQIIRMQNGLARAVPDRPPADVGVRIAGEAAEELRDAGFAALDLGRDPADVGIGKGQFRVADG